MKVPPQSHDVVITSINVRPDDVDAFKKAIAEVTSESAKEAGVVSFYAMQHNDDPCRFAFFDVFENREAFERHLTTPHIREFSRRIGAMVTENPTIEHFTGLRDHSK